MSWSDLFTDLKNTLKNVWEEHFKSIMLLAVILIGQIIILVVFTCPCVSLSELGVNCTSEIAFKEGLCVKLPNKKYGLCFIIAPAVCLFFIGIAASVDSWISPSKYLPKPPTTVQDIRCIQGDWLKKISFSILPPLIWVCIAMIVGDYYACAFTALPYDVDRKDEANGKVLSQYENCEVLAVAKEKFTSNAYNKNCTKSQYIGWIVVAVSIGLFMIFYAAIKCFCNSCHYRHLYSALYYAYEQEEIETAIKEKAKENARKNVIREENEEEVRGSKRTYNLDLSEWWIGEKTESEETQHNSEETNGTRETEQSGRDSSQIRKMQTKFSPNSSNNGSLVQEYSCNQNETEPLISNQ